MKSKVLFPLFIVWARSSVRIEHRTFNPVVVGPNPAGPAILLIRILIYGYKVCLLSGGLGVNPLRRGNIQEPFDGFAFSSFFNTSIK